MFESMVTSSQAKNTIKLAEARLLHITWDLLRPRDAILQGKASAFGSEGNKEPRVGVREKTLEVTR